MPSYVRASAVGRLVRPPAPSDNKENRPPRIRSSSRAQTASAFPSTLLTLLTSHQSRGFAGLSGGTRCLTGCRAPWLYSIHPDYNPRPTSLSNITMLLLHQTGAVKIGEIVRYTLTWTPAADMLLPSPSVLHLRIRNTSAIALRAAFVHGPYTLYVAAYPADFDPNTKWEQGRERGVPEFEPTLKAGGSWTASLKVPEHVRSGAGQGYGGDRSMAHQQQQHQRQQPESISWIIEVSSQVIFSNSAAVHYEILLGRDEKSLSLGGFGSSNLLGGTSSGAGTIPGQVTDHQQSRGAQEGEHNAQPKGVYSRAIQLTVDDTASLWNRPRMPEWDDASAQQSAAAQSGNAPAEKAKAGDVSAKEQIDGREEEALRRRKRKRKNVHLVILTHGLHSNLGADMLFLKESIDAAARRAKNDARKWREARSKSQKSTESTGDKSSHQDQSTGETKTEEDYDEEEVMVRGFSGNAVRTERGIKYLGKRLAKYILTMTYPDQPYKPVTKKAATEAFSHALRPELQKLPPNIGTPTHKDSTILKHSWSNTDDLAYKITSISFIAHSLGGLVQTYAVAYIQKHSPAFFDYIKPINFIAMASPFLGLSNENPLYVRFALDFGLVGRTGQDLGLTWRAPTLARSGWGAIVSGIGESAHKKLERDAAPESKPLLRILPTGPAHIVLKKFKNRTIYSNVVNDGVVPLRTSCLLFLDWQGLGRVEKARRENGLVGTVLEWGWAEVTGANSSSPDRRQSLWSESEGADENAATQQGHGEDVPQPSSDTIDKDNAQNLKVTSVPSTGVPNMDNETSNAAPTTNTNALTSIMSFFKPNPAPPNHEPNSKSSRIYKRSQTLKLGEDASSTTSTSPNSSPHNGTTGQGQDRGRSLKHEDLPHRPSAPPKTTFFEAAGDLLKPPIPNIEFFIDPSSRPQTIFHDRVYHPEDIPPPPLKKRTTSSLLRKSKPATQSASSPASSTTSPGISPSDTDLSSKDLEDTANTGPPKQNNETVDGSAMKVEEKIARAYHRDLSWRKVLVRLEPDAHNNMIVRRMFANAHGWPVVQHLCEVHFGFDPQVNDDLNVFRTSEPASGLGFERQNQGDASESRTSREVDIERIEGKGERTRSESREARDTVPALHATPHPRSLGKALAQQSQKRPTFDRLDSVEMDEENWSERVWGDSEGDLDTDDEGGSGGLGWNLNWTEAIAGRGAAAKRQDKEKEKEKDRTNDTGKGQSGESAPGTDESEIRAFLGKSPEVGNDIEGAVAGDRSAKSTYIEEPKGGSLGRQQDKGEETLAEEALAARLLSEEQ